MHVRLQKQPTAVGTSFWGAQPGARVKVGLGEFLARPPLGAYWHRPMCSDTFTLHAHHRQPVLELGDVIGVRAGDRMPLAPRGLDLVQIYDPVVGADEKQKAAKLFKVVAPPAVAAVLDLPKPAPSGAVALDVTVPTSPPPNTRWMPYLVDGRDLRRILAVPIAA